MTLISDKPIEHNAAPSAAPNIVDVTVQNFMLEVVQASLQVPVLAYFTASWCGPCKQFGPLLEKVVNGANGRVRLAKIDIDKSPQLAQQFRIQSVPMVYIFVNGQPADAFSGPLQESQLKQAIAPFVSATPEEEDAKAILAKAKELLAAGDAEQALQYYQAVALNDKDNVEAITGTASAFVALGKLEMAEKLLTALPENVAGQELVVAAKAKLSLAKNAPSAGKLGELKAELAKSPYDNQIRYDYSNALFAAGKAEEAIAELLCIIAADKNWNDAAARKQILTIFEALGFEHPLAAQGRRRLSAILFK